MATGAGTGFEEPTVRSQVLRGAAEYRRNASGKCPGASQARSWRTFGGGGWRRCRRTSGGATATESVGLLLPASTPYRSGHFFYYPMPFVVSIVQASAEYPEYTFVDSLTPSEQKAAFHVRNANGEDLCLKIIAPSFDIARLQREIMALQAIRHPNVVSLREYTFSTTQGKQRHFLVEEFIEGSDLTLKLLVGARWPLAEAQTFFAALCDGLNALRTADVVHRDLKPSNIRVRLDGSPVIIDFGLARHLGLSDLTCTSEGAAIGTPLFFAPEQFTGTKREIDHRTDLFAVGVLLYHALVGHHPFLTGGMTGLAQLRDAVCSSSDFQNDTAFLALPERWRTLVARLLSKERAQRPRAAEQVASIIRQLDVIV